MFSFYHRKPHQEPREMAPGTIRQRLEFHGRVQGVGFRYQAVEAAHTLGLTGWVKNEYDGTVSMEAQGTAEQIDALIQTLRQRRYIRIDRVWREDIPVKPEERTFRETY